jgi:hypothetical protein
MLISPLRRLILVLNVGLLAGCHASAPPPATSPAARSIGTNPSSPAPASPKPSETTIVDAAPAPGTAQALAQRAATYAQSVEPVFAQHSSSRPTEASDFPEHDWSRPLTNEPAPRQAAVIDAHPVPAAPVVQKRLESPPPRQATAQPSVQNAQPTPVATIGSDAIGARLDKRAADYPEDLSAQADDQLLRLLREESVPDMQALSHLAPEDRELLSALMDALTNFRNQLRQNSNMIFSQKIAPLVDLSDRLRSQAELTIPTFVVCTDALYFGKYTKLDPARLAADQPHKVRIYYEVENFSSQFNDSSKDYETKLDEQLVLYTESSGLPVWSSAKRNMPDTSHRRRRDFFVAEEIALPRTLTIGRYLLKVTVEDQQARRIAENTVPIEIVAQ